MDRIDRSVLQQVFLEPFVENAQVRLLPVLGAEFPPLLHHDPGECLVNHRILREQVLQFRLLDEHVFGSCKPFVFNLVWRHKPRSHAEEGDTLLESVQAVFGNVLDIRDVDSEDYS